MGVHFVNFALVDGKPDSTAPEALIYEVKNGRARLVGVEVHRPGGRLGSRASRAAGAGARGPSVSLQREPEPLRSTGVLELHVWAWRDNPNGTGAAEDGIPILPPPRL